MTRIPLSLIQEALDYRIREPARVCGDFCPETSPEQHLYRCKRIGLLQIDDQVSQP